MEPCPDCEEFRTIVDPVPKHVHWCHERIAELEAALENTLPSEWTRLRLRAEKAEAENSRAWEKVRSLESQTRGLEAGIHWWKEKLAQAEGEVEHWRDIASSLNEVVERQGAEVERLRHLGGVPPGVSPSPPHSEWKQGQDGLLRCTTCGAVQRYGRKEASP